MEWQTASDILARKVGRHGTFMAQTKEGFLFGLGSSKALVTTDGRVLLDGDRPATEAHEKPNEDLSLNPPVNRTMIAKVIGKNTVHMAAFAPGGQAVTACNPKKTFYSVPGDIQVEEGSLEQVTCKVCGWVIAKRKKDESSQKS